MQILAHRILKPSKEYEAVEIDVQVDEGGAPVVWHDCTNLLIGKTLHTYMEQSAARSIFVDIKQNLPVEQLRNIVDVVGDRLLGLFDVPFPSAYFARKEGLPIYARLSEYEPVNRLFDSFWVDPLAAQTFSTHAHLITSTDPHHKLVVACPSLHGHHLEYSRDVWRTFKRLNESTGRRQWGNILGMVTKFPLEARSFLNG